MHRGSPAEAFQAADVVAGLAAGVHALFVVVGAEVGVAGGGVGQQGVDDGERGVAGGDQGLLFRHPPGQPPVFRAEERLGAGGADRHFAEGGAQVGVAAAGGVAALALAGGLADLGGPFRPGDQVGGGGEDGHVGADLGDDVLGADLPDAVDLVELGDLAQVRFGQYLDLLGERLDLGGVVVDGGEHHGQHGGVLAGEERAVQRLFKPFDLGAHGAAGQLGQHRGVTLPGGDSVQHVPAGDAVDVGDDAGQFQVPVFQELLDPLLFGGAGLGGVAAVGGVGSPPAGRPRRR